MNRFIIVDGLPYLYANGKAYSVRWDSAGFTVGTEANLKSVPTTVYSELSIKAQCAGHLDSIGAEPEDAPGTDPVAEPEDAPGTDPVAEQVEPEPEEKALDDMDLAELKEYAKVNGIRLGGARTKPTIKEAINSALNGR